MFSVISFSTIHCWSFVWQNNLNEIVLFLGFFEKLFHCMMSRFEHTELARVSSHHYAITSGCVFWRGWGSRIDFGDLNVFVENICIYKLEANLLGGWKSSFTKMIQIAIQYFLWYPFSPSILDNVIMLLIFPVFPEIFTPHFMHLYWWDATGVWYSHIFPHQTLYRL